MNRRHMRLATALAVLASALLAVAGVSAATSSVSRASTKVCEIADDAYPGDGYFTGGYYTVRGVSCRTGKKLMIAYYKCRMRHGGKDGKCPTSTKLLGTFTCREKRQSIPTEINARVTCRRTGAEVVHTYQQNT